MSKTYFISDTHFGHANLVRLARTEFADIVRHDMTIRQNWRDTVGKDDEVWMLGDFAYRCGYALEPLLRDLPGHKHLVMGNHDHMWIKQNPKALEQFESVQQMAEIDLNGLHLFLCHYPMVEWNMSRHGSILIHGHIHNNTDHPFWPLMAKTPTMLNASVDINHWKPVTLGELVKNNEDFKKNHLQEDSF